MENATARLETDIGMVGIETGEGEDRPALLHNAANMVAEPSSDPRNDRSSGCSEGEVTTTVRRLEAKLDELLKRTSSWNRLPQQPRRPAKFQCLDEHVMPATLDESLREGTWLRGKVKKWHIEKGFGFISVPTL